MIYIGVPMSEAGPSPSARVVDASGAPVANATVLDQRVGVATAKVKVRLPAPGADAMAWRPRGIMAGGGLRRRELDGDIPSSQRHGLGKHSAFGVLVCLVCGLHLG